MYWSCECSLWEARNISSTNSSAGNLRLKLTLLYRGTCQLLPYIISTENVQVNLGDIHNPCVHWAFPWSALPLSSESSPSSHRSNISCLYQVLCWQNWGCPVWFASAYQPDPNLELVTFTRVANDQQDIGSSHAGTYLNIFTGVATYLWWQTTYSQFNRATVEPYCREQCNSL